MGVCSLPGKIAVLKHMFTDISLRCFTTWAAGQCVGQASCSPITQAVVRTRWCNLGLGKVWVWGVSIPSFTIWVLGAELGLGSYCTCSDILWALSIGYFVNPFTVLTGLGVLGVGTYINGHHCFWHLMLIASLAFPQERSLLISCHINSRCSDMQVTC